MVRRNTPYQNVSTVNTWRCTIVLCNTPSTAIVWCTMRQHTNTQHNIPYRTVRCDVMIWYDVVNYNNECRKKTTPYILWHIMVWHKSSISITIHTTNDMPIVHVHGTRSTGDSITVTVIVNAFLNVDMDIKTHDYIFHQDEQLHVMVRCNVIY